MQRPIIIGLAACGGLAALALTTAPSFAIDCAKASTATEKAICANSDAHRADDEMAAAFGNLKSSLKPAQQKLLVANQAGWISGRDTCGMDEDGQEQTDQHKIAACVVQQSDGRRKFLLGLPAEGPGAPDALVPVIKEGADQSFFTSLDFVAPKTAGEKLFNATLDGEMKKYHLARNADDYTDGFEVTLKYASPELLSAYVSASDQSPKLAHPMDNTHNLNIDLKTGKVLKMTDAFDAVALAGIEATCLAQLKDYMASDSVTGDVEPELIKADIEQLPSWSFGATEATLVFDPIDAEPTGVCHLPYADLRKLVEPGFPLPQ